GGGGNRAPRRLAMTNPDSVADFIRGHALAALFLLAPAWAPAVLAQAPPAPPVQVSPSGPVTTVTPTYTWRESAGATRYWVEVSNGAAFVFRGLYGSEQVCIGGTCGVTQGPGLTAGAYDRDGHAQRPRGEERTTPPARTP